MGERHDEEVATGTVPAAGESLCTTEAEEVKKLRQAAMDLFGFELHRQLGSGRGRNVRWGCHDHRRVVRSARF